MGKWKEISPDKFKEDPFTMIGKDWMLIAAENDGRVNAMTAAWGGLGVMWAMNTAFIFVRESRFTKTLIDGADTFSLTFFDHEKYKNMYGYMGSISGRDQDKVAQTGLTVVRDETGTPFFEEAQLAIICRKLSATPITPDQFIDPTIDGRHYSDKDYHTMYIGEILKILR